jgi:hypothetical protein
LSEIALPLSRWDYTMLGCDLLHFILSCYVILGKVSLCIVSKLERGRGSTK